MMNGCVLTVVSNGRSGVFGTTVGADTAFIIHGNPEEAHAWAIEQVRSMERAGHRIKNATLVRSDSESFSGPDLVNIHLDSATAEATLALNPEELQLVLELRAKREAKEAAKQLQRKVLSLVSPWLEYSDRTGEELTFSTFVNSFYYQEPDAQTVYERLVKVISAAHPSSSN